MDAGSLAQMQSSTFSGSDGPTIPNLGGLASRRGGQNIKPLSFEILAPGSEKEAGAATPRTSRSHLLAGLRTAPKSATAGTFPSSPTAAAPTTRFSRIPTTSSSYSHDGVSNGPKTSLPRFPQGQTYNQHSTYGQQYTAEQILAPPEIQLDEQDASTLGVEYAELVATNMYLAAQKQRLQQQLMSVQAAQQQFQNMSIGNTHQAMQPSGYQHLLYQQQQQQQMLASGLSTVNNVYAVVDPLTGQQTLYVGQGASQLNNHFVDQYNTNLQQLQQLQLIQQQLQQQQTTQHRQASPAAAPRVHVSPPPSETHNGNFRNQSPPRQHASTPEQHAPLPPPSANAFRRGHKKAVSLVGSNLASINTGSVTLNHEAPKSAGPKSTSFPTSVQTGTYGPGQGRAGEHPIRQPRGPPNFDELARKPTAKDEGSKNFAARTRRSAVRNLMRAGITRRQVTVSGSSGSISPISESAEELAIVLTDDESVSGRSGSGSLNGDDVECSLPSSRTSTGSWGAIGSERPGSREKFRNSADSPNSPSEPPSGSFASVFKSAAPASESDSQRKPSRLVLSNAEKRRCAAA
ncbi:hypothetical protein CMQ_5479 [Grosmannia clavigera kw1407]|uniref:Uncharacterized protein n=1 Tax=Grosmannia clavigera (strain kw1407 / UAMH 11150) TaxID=655863 RepID=F0XRN1_GROCL|nr:uncharacterized protein CMQ_5479 [Grosmannia clavigera kw1407]EFW99668.1 hypothetical protein CMQ_5479 [Grosmannia clavigera kw1407]